jgi:hypothetical protein
MIKQLQLMSLDELGSLLGSENVWLAIPQQKHPTQPYGALHGFNLLSEQSNFKTRVVVEAWNRLRMNYYVACPEPECLRLPSNEKHLSSSRLG